MANAFEIGFAALRQNSERICLFMNYRTVNVNASEKYSVYIGKGLLDCADDFIAAAVESRRAAIVTDDNVAPIYMEKLCGKLSNAGFDICSFVFPHGEKSKSYSVLMEIYGFLCKNHITRSDCIIALGGGVVGDITGYAAATYLRGLDFIQIPTTLLAQVDSSVGGKTAIDLPEGKNLVGAFKQPCIVLCDTKTLETLPEDFLIDGMGEVVKYGMIKSAPLFSQLENASIDKIGDFAEDIVEQCISIKRDVVEADEFDHGERMLLNFGHTIGHSIEKYYGYTGITHGKAVAEGMALITKIAEKNKICTEGLYDRLNVCLKKYKLNSEKIPDISLLADACLNDKKRMGGSINIIVCSDVGCSSSIKMTVEDFM